MVAIKERKREKKITEEKQEIKEVGTVGHPLSRVKLKNSVEVYEQKVFFIQATNKPDAEEVMRAYLQSQDKILSVQSKRNGYEAVCLVFRMREFREF